VLYLKVLTQRHFVAEFYQEIVGFTRKTGKVEFLSHTLENLGVTYAIHP